MKSLVLTLFVAFLLLPMASGQDQPNGSTFQITLMSSDGTTPYCDSPVIALNGVLVSGMVNMTTYCGLSADGVVVGTYGIAFQVPPIPANTWGYTVNIASTGYYANGFGINVVYILDFKNKLWSLAVGDGVSSTIVNQGTFYIGAPSRPSRISSLSAARTAGK